jgi:L-threonylcarbamoyladenylate synthase
MPRFQQAVDALKAGECIAYPTEGVWGLGCDPKNKQALIELNKLKPRKDGKGYILLASSLNQFEDFIDTKVNRKKLMTKWPGPHTWIVEVKNGAKAQNLAIQNTIALRLSNHEPIERLCSLFNGPIVSTSANQEGKEPAMTKEEVKKNFPDIFILEGHLGGLSKPTPLQYLDSEEWARR